MNNLLFLQKINDDGSQETAKRIIYLLLQSLVFFLASKDIIYELWQEYQVPKDYYYFRGVTWLLILILIVRHIPIKRYEVWVTIAIGLLISFVKFRIMDIRPETYGDVLFKVLVFKNICYVLFAALAVDMIRSGILKNLWNKRNISLGAYTIIMIIVSIAHLSAFTFLIPGLALAVTMMNEDRWISVTDSFAIGYYLASMYLMLKSEYICLEPIRNNRYVGMFASNENAGMIAGGAFLCVVYFFVRLINLNKKKWFYYLFILGLSCLPVYFLLKTDSRTTYLGLLIIISLALVFLIGKVEKKRLIIRCVLLLIVPVIIVLLLYSAAFVLYKYRVGDQAGIHQDFVVKLTRLVDPSFNEGYFRTFSLLNHWDGFTSGRLGIAMEYAKQITWMGHQFEPVTYLRTVINDPHNIFLEALIEMGIIRGGLFILWILYSFIVCVIKAVKSRNKSVFMSLLWIPYSIVILSATILGWRSIVPLMMFFFMYPVFDRIEANIKA